MAASSRRLAARLRGLGSLSSSKDAAALNSLQPWRSLFRWARDEMPAEPTVPPRPAQRTCGDQQWMDEYSWLEGGGAEVQRVLRQEARYADGWLRRIAALAERLHEQMLELVPEEQVTAPERVGSHEYWVQQLPDAPHPCYMRRAAGQLGAAPEVVLDLNELAAVHGEYVQAGQMKLSRCGQRVAFTLEEGQGEESWAAFTRDLQTGATHHLSALGTVVSLEWAADGRTLLCTQPNELGRPWRVLACDAAAAAGSGGRWRAGGGGGRGSWVVFEENDERFFVELGRTKDWSFLTINCNSKTSSEVHLLPADLRAPHCQQLSLAAAGAAGAAGVEPRLVQQRQPGLEYFLEHNGGHLYLLSNAHGALDYAVYRVPADAASLAQDQWQLVVGEQPGVANEDMDMTRDWLVLYQRRQGRQQVAALPLRHGLPAAAAAAVARGAAAGADGSGRAGTPAAAAAAAAAAAVAPQPAAAPPAAGPAASLLQLAPLPAWALSVAAGANADFELQQLRLMLSSPVHPERAFDWELATGHLLQQPGPAAAAGGGDGVEQQGQPEQRLAWQQLWATSADGTAVPLTVACAAEALPPGSRGGSSDGSDGGSSCGGGSNSPLRPRPCLLVVYGAYGHTLPTGYLAERLPLLRRGWVLALAHVRGGGELGRRWHAAGRGALKANSLADLEACLDHLFEAGWTAPGLVALKAHSAGGLTAGALLNRRPGDLGAALLEAPFVDVLSAMSDPSLPLTVHEYEEWGDPQQPGAFERIKSLCPYQGVCPAPYPPTLLTCSQADVRVPYWGPLKHAARLRAAAAQHADSGGSSSSSGSSGWQPGPILLLPDEQAGHFVHERDLYTTKAEQYAFLVAAVEGQLQPSD